MSASDVFSPTTYRILQDSTNTLSELDRAHSCGILPVPRVSDGLRRRRELCTLYRSLPHPIVRKEDPYRRNTLDESSPTEDARTLSDTTTRKKSTPIGDARILWITTTREAFDAPLVAYRRRRHSEASQIGQPSNARFTHKRKH